MLFSVWRHTVYFVGRGFDDLVVPQPLCLGSRAHATKTADDVLGYFSVVCELLAQLLDHAVYVVEFCLVAGRRGNRHPAAHVGAVHAIHCRLWRLPLACLVSAPSLQSCRLLW